MELNLAAARRIDAKINAVIDSASQVALYEYDDKDKDWRKTEHEGSLLVCEYVSNPLTYCFIVLNRLNPKNFMKKIDANIEFQRKNEYLLYKLPNNKVCAVWFYDEKDCGRVYESLTRAMNALKKNAGVSAFLSNFIEKSSTNNLTGEESRVKETKGDKYSSPNKSADILKLLSKAHDDYGKQNMSRHVHKQTTEPKPNPSTPSTIPVPLESLFKSVTPAKASSPLVPQHAAGKRPPTHSLELADDKTIKSVTTPSSDVPPALQRLLSMPAGGTDYTINSETTFKNPQVSGAGDMTPIRQVAAPPVSSSPLLPLSDASYLMKENNLDLITPSDLSVVFERASNSNGDGCTNDLLPLPSRNRVDNGQHDLYSVSHQCNYSCSSTCSELSTLDQCRPMKQLSMTKPNSVNMGVERFREMFIHLLQNDNKFVDQLYHSFMNASVFEECSSNDAGPSAFSRVSAFEHR